MYFCQYFVCLDFLLVLESPEFRGYFVILVTRCRYFKLS